MHRPGLTLPSLLLLAAGYVAWAVVLSGVMIELGAGGWKLGTLAAVRLGALGCFAGAFWFVAARPNTSVAGRKLAHAAQSIAATTLAAILSSQLSLVLLVVTAAQAPLVWPTRHAAAWVAAQTVVPLVVLAPGKSWSNVTLLVASYAAFQGFAWVMAYLMRSEAAGREKLAATLAELAGTQAELGEAYRVAERLRIARELHDQIGHQLTALAIQLEVAQNTRGEEAESAVGSATSLAREALDDLRAVVSTLRHDPEFDLSTALRGLAARIREPEIALSLPPSALVGDSAVARVLFRCAQEAVTNAARHSRARRLELSLERAVGGIRLVARDDGQGGAAPRFGNGLSGLRERLAEVHGKLQVTSLPGRGFTLTAWVPEGAA